MFVPALIEIASNSNCSRSIDPFAKACATSLMYTVATNTLSLIADSSAGGGEHRGELLPAVLREHEVDHRREQVLVVDDRDDREERHQQRGERQRLLERVPDRALVDHAVEGGREHDDAEADEPDLGHVEGEAGDEQQRGDALHDQLGGLAR